MGKICTIYNFQNEVRRQTSANETIRSFIFLIPWSRLESWAVCGCSASDTASRTICAFYLGCCRSQNLIVKHVYEMDSHLQRIKCATPQLLLLLLLVGARIEMKTKEEKKCAQCTEDRTHTTSAHMWSSVATLFSKWISILFFFELFLDRPSYKFTKLRQFVSDALRCLRGNEWANQMSHIHAHQFWRRENNTSHMFSMRL